MIGIVGGAGGVGKEREALYEQFLEVAEVVWYCGSSVSDSKESSFGIPGLLDHLFRTVKRTKIEKKKLET